MTRTAPKTIEMYRNELIIRMRSGKAIIDRLKKTGEWADYVSQQEANPTGGPETSFSRPSARELRAARQLEAEGVVVVARGSLSIPANFGFFAYLIAGPNFPQQV